MKTQDVRQIVRRGTVAGLIGTMTMTAPILAGRRLGLLSTPPPVEISSNVARRVPLLPEPGDRGFSATWLGGHLAYGAGCGILYGFSKRFLPTAPVPAGLLFGSAVWVTSYLGVVPALGLYPIPQDDRRSRLLVMIAAHEVFGLTVAWASRRELDS